MMPRNLKVLEIIISLSAFILVFTTFSQGVTGSTPCGEMEWCTEYCPSVPGYPPFWCVSSCITNGDCGPTEVCDWLYCCDAYRVGGQVFYITRDVKTCIEKGCDPCSYGDCTGKDANNPKCGESGKPGGIEHASTGCSITDDKRFLCCGTEWYSCDDDETWDDWVENAASDGYESSCTEPNTGDNYCCDQSQGGSKRWSYCGDGNANTVSGCDEECDGSDLDGETCQSQGFDGGTLGCNSDCTFDTSGCTTITGCAACDDGSGSGPPYTWDCKGGDDNHCQDNGGLGFYYYSGGSCNFWGDSHFRCYNGNWYSCDSSQSWANFNYGPGQSCPDGVCCDPSAAPAYWSYCGDGNANTVSGCDEQCDGSDLDGETCQSQGFDGGTLGCNSDCTFDTSGCTTITGCAACGDGTWDCTNGERCGNNGDIGYIERAYAGCSVSTDPRFYCYNDEWYSCHTSCDWSWVENCQTGGDTGSDYCCDPSQGGTAKWSECGDGNVNTVCNEECESDNDCPNYCGSGNVRYYSGSCPSCTCSYSTKDCDDDDSWYCDPGNVRVHRDYYCSGGNCDYSDSNRYDCDNDDGWIDVGSAYSCCNGNEACTSCQDQEERNYYCSGGGCTYSITNTRTVRSGCSACPSDDCYPYGNGCEDRNYYCSGGSCDYDYSNRNTDYTESEERYCSGDDIMSRGLFHDYYCDGGTCTDHASWQASRLIEDCNNYDGYYCTGTTLREEYDYTCRENGDCGSGSGDPECAGYRQANQEDCSDNNACSGGCPGCTYREYYCSGSTGCGGAGNLCCNPTSPGANCNSYNLIDPDTNQARCEGCSQIWNLGGDVSNCCGDDSNEYVRTRECDGYACNSDPNDDACCDQTSDCVWNSVCYANGANHPTMAADCNNGIWRARVCMGKQCGEPCLFGVGICDGPDGNCYADGGCFLDCSVPSPGSGNQRIWENSNCGRTDSYKCGPQHICPNSLTSCITGGSSVQVTGTWSSYVPPSGSYEVGDTSQITINGISNSPSGFTILTECKVVKPNGNIIYFNNWGSGNLQFSYTIQANDPEGVWTVDYCGLWSDFKPNEGWSLKIDNTNHSFTVDKSSPTVSVTGAPANWQNTDATANISCSDSYSGCDSGTYKLITYASSPGSCPSTYSSYTLPIPQTISSHKWVCGAAKDNAGHTGFSSPVEFKIDKVLPSSKVNMLSTYAAETSFDLSWSGTDDKSGMDCYTIQYKYQPPGEPETPVENITFPGGECTKQMSMTFDAELVTGASNADGYIFHFRSLAKDNAGNQETKTTFDTQTEIFLTMINFLVDETFRVTLGKLEIVKILVRNSQLIADTIHLSLNLPEVKFVDTYTQTIDLDMNPQEYKTVTAKIYPKSLGSFNLTVNAVSATNPQFTGSDWLEITVLTPAEFPGLSPLAIAFLIIFAVLIYLKFVLR